MEIKERVELALEQIRPYLIADGGNVKILDIVDESILYIELLGSCGNCPMSTITVKAGIEEAVRKEVPEIKTVISSGNEEFYKAGILESK